MVAACLLSYSEEEQKQIKKIVLSPGKKLKIMNFKHWIWWWLWMIWMIWKMKWMICKWIIVKWNNFRVKYNHHIMICMIHIKLVMTCRIIHMVHLVLCLNHINKCLQKQLQLSLSWSLSNLPTDIGKPTAPPNKFFRNLWNIKMNFRISLPPTKRSNN